MPRLFLGSKDQLIILAMQGQKVVRGALVCVITGFKVNNWIVVNHGVVVAVNMR